MKRFTAPFIPLLFSLSFSCGGGQTQGAAFETPLQDDGIAMAALQQRLQNTPVTPIEPFALGVFGERALVGVSLSGGKPWMFEHPIACRPLIAGSVVVGAGANEMFGLDAKTGNLLWSRKVGGCLRGAADNGQITAISIEPITGYGGIVVAIDREGQVVRQVEDASKIGVPSMLNGILFMPWGGRYVSAYDLAVGEEVARIRFPFRVTRAFTANGHLYFGERVAARFDAQIGLASEGKAWTLALPSRALPDDPAWMDSGHDALAPKASASDQVRAYALPANGPSPAFAANRYAATHGRVAMGLSATNGELLWAHAHTSSFLGGAAYAGGFALCDADGNVTFLDSETGNVAGKVFLGVPVDACLVEAAGVTNTKTGARPLRDEIAEVVALRYEDSLPIQRFLLSELARLPDEQATETLIQLLVSGAYPTELYPDVRSALVLRTNGTSHMLQALAKSPDFLEGTSQFPPLGALSDALQKNFVTQAAPLLSKYLLDFSVPAHELERVAAALSVLAGSTEVSALRSFFAMYRSEHADAHIVLAVAHVAEALVRLNEAQIVLSALSDPYTSNAVRTQLAALSARSATTAGKAPN